MSVITCLDWLRVHVFTVSEVENGVKCDNGWMDEILN